ncbi:hypothetical protein [Pedobacter insulae]|uniref:Uncharacterized protein n=1 Tax=Pedobacter insulae TaxID=414048 RepID=A0A1I2XA16_9SPHI|nr:hypothetical protein [Pedobacter insulae]SFH10345.1 hypothetical protein SAMN04489864_10594 [Pedobacter insulae]
MSDGSFYFKIGKVIYEALPEDDGVYTIFKDGGEYIQVTQHASLKWLRIDYKTDLPVIEENEEVDAIGRVIVRYLKENP